MPRIVKALIDLDFVIIPRGGGTGYTGGAVPLHSRSAVINTEKLNRISDVEMRKLEGLDKEVATIQSGAGSVNKKVNPKERSTAILVGVAAGRKLLPAFRASYCRLPHFR